MKTYSLGNPPELAGIYYLINKTTGEIYVGKSNNFKRRYFEWKNVVATGYGHRGAGVITAIQNTPDPNQWHFIVAIEMPDAGNYELVKKENEEIARLQKKHPGKILNGTTITLANTSTPAYTNTRSVDIISDEGGVIGYMIAAKLLGRNYTTIRDKVQYLRDNGVKQVKLEDLLMDRRKILEKYLEPLTS